MLTLIAGPLRMVWNTTQYRSVRSSSFCRCSGFDGTAWAAAAGLPDQRRQPTIRGQSRCQRAGVFGGSQVTIEVCAWRHW
jgi:hypothetical protein